MKRFKNLDPSEERELGLAFQPDNPAVAGMVEYLQQGIVTMDKELSLTSKLYQRANADLYVAALLARREASFNLLSVLTDQITLDIDQMER